MLRAMELLKQEIRKVTAIAIGLAIQGFSKRAAYRTKEAVRLQVIYDLLEKSS